MTVTGWTGHPGGHGLCRAPAAGRARPARDRRRGARRRAWAGYPISPWRACRMPRHAELLVSVVRWPLDERVRERVLGEARGNPLALRELPRDGSLVELTGGFGPPGTLPLVDRIEERFRRQIADLPADTRRLLQIAAACPVGDPARVWRAAYELSMPAQAAAPAVRGRPHRVRHLGCGSAIRWCARRPTTPRRSASGRKLARALAEAADPVTDPTHAAPRRRAPAAPRPGRGRRGRAGPVRGEGAGSVAASWPRRPPTSTVPRRRRPIPPTRAQRLLERGAGQA